MKRHPTIAFLRECLTYDPIIGVVWLHRPLEHFGSKRAQSTFNSKYAGRRAGTLQDGRRLIHLRPFGLFKEHRVIVALLKGEWPEHEVDHRRGDPSQNHHDNLREASHAENHQNRLASETTGTYRDKKRWGARIMLNGVNHRLGNFDTRAEAHQAYLDAKAKLHSFQPVARKVVGG